VLFEMLAGRAPFAGDTPTDTLAAIVEREPPWKALPQELPQIVSDVLRRCLAKDPRRRFHDLADARLQLEDALSAPPATASTTTRQRAWLPIVIGLIAGVTVTATVAGFMLRGRTTSAGSTSSTPAARVVRFRINPNQLLDEQACASVNCGESVLALSP